MPLSKPELWFLGKTERYLEGKDKLSLYKKFILLAVLHKLSEITGGKQRQEIIEDMKNIIATL